MGATKAPPAPAKPAPAPNPTPAPAKPAEPKAAGPGGGAAGKADAAKDQQKSAGNQAAGAGSAAAPSPPAPPPSAPIELKGQSDFPISPGVDAYLQGTEKGIGAVPIQFGKLASGTIQLRRNERKAGKGDAAATVTYDAKDQGIALTHPLFRGIDDAAVTPQLVVEVKAGKITGHVGIAEGKKITDAGKALSAAPEIIGLAGFKLPSKLSLTNAIEAGSIHLGVDSQFVLGGAFSGHLKLDVIDENIAFEASANVEGKGLATGAMGMQRSVEGVITGQAAIQLKLPKNFTGGIDVNWDGRAVTGQGKVGYTGEKFSGEIVLHLMEASEAARLEAEKKAPPQEGDQAEAGGDGKPTKPRKKSDKVDYAVFGEGDLTFSFTDWLTGTAHVIVDSKGFVTVIGEITPQKEFQLFEPKEYVEKLFKVEARATYGIPVVGNIFLFANVGMDAFAKLDGKLYDIKVTGTYSTDPEKSRSFSIQGTLNISAGAGLRLRAEGGAGLEILDHDIKAGAGINGIAGIKGYAKATPIIGYREKAAAGEDKKGEFFIRGELEIAAQPFLGLSGDLFVELDSPWWSPAPDKKWTWPLGSKEWPIGGSFGIGAKVDYVFGSGQMPSVEFKKAEFSADNFMSDLMNDKAKPKSVSGGDKQGEWKEKNSAEAEAPTAAKGGGVAPVGGPGAAGGASPEAKPKVAAGGSKGGKGAKGEVSPDARTAEGHAVKDLQEKAQKEGKGQIRATGGGPPPAVAAAKGGPAPEKKPEKPEKPEKPVPGAKSVDRKPGLGDSATVEHDDRVKHGLLALQQLTDHFSKEGASKEDLNPSVKAVRKKYSFKSIDVVAGDDTWDYKYVASAPKQLPGPKRKKGKVADDLADSTSTAKPDPKHVEPAPPVAGKAAAKGPLPAFRTFEQADQAANQQQADRPESKNPPHVLGVLVFVNGRLAKEWYEVSESGFGMKGHTEQKALARMEFQPGTTIEFVGHYPPCNLAGGCYTAMAAFAKERHVNIGYRTVRGESATTIYEYPSGEDPTKQSEIPKRGKHTLQ